MNKHSPHRTAGVFIPLPMSPVATVLCGFSEVTLHAVVLSLAGKMAPQGQDLGVFSILRKDISMLVMLQPLSFTT